MTSLILSPQQQAIINEINEPTSRHMRIEAVAGSGKTTTIELAIQELPKLARAQYMAFNKSNVNDILYRMGEDDERIEVATFNATGFRALRRGIGFPVKVDSGKTYKMLDTFSDTPEDRYIRGCIARIVSLAKSNLILPNHDTSELYDLLNYMGMLVDEEDLVVNCASFVLQYNYEFTDHNGVIDFDDMLYLPLTLNLPFQKKTHLFVDECQDTNVANFEMVKKMLTDNGRCFLVGDSHQAIYGFRGASAGAMEIMSEHFNAGRLPLSITYRCAKAIVELAQEFVPEIEARPGAPKGEIVRNETLKLEELQPQDMILCRLNSPLMPLAWRLLHLGKPFNMLGKDLQGKLERVIKKVQKKNDSMTSDAFESLLWDYHDKEEEKLLKKKAFGLLHALKDEVYCLVHLCSAVQTVEEIKELLVRIFRSKNGIKVSTVHKAKGTEAPHVVILDADKYMPFERASTPLEIQQEDNIYYVAITRAKDKLTFASSEDLI